MCAIIDKLAQCEYVAARQARQSRCEQHRLMTDEDMAIIVTRMRVARKSLIGPPYRHIINYCNTLNT